MRLYSLAAWPAAFVLLAGVLWPTAAHAVLVNRWSFNAAAGAVGADTVILDPVSNAQAIIRGNGAVFSGTELTLPGNTTGAVTPATIAAYVDLPNGIISSKTNLTVEIWATPLAAQNWMRLCDFGRVNGATVGGGAAGEITGTGNTAPAGKIASDNLMLSFSRGTNLGVQRCEAMLDGGTLATLDTNLATTAGTKYHYVLTFEDGVGTFGASGGRVTWYRNGQIAATGDVAFHLSSLEDVNNWLGRSQYVGDSMANAAYDELRIYNHAFTAAEVLASRDAGPNAFPDPQPAPPTVIPPLPVARWSFNASAGAAPAGTAYADSIGGAIATIQGNGATLSGQAVVLPGTTNGDQTPAAISAYIDLPNGIVSSKTNFSVEVWATPLSEKVWMRVFDFGRVNTAGVGGGAAGEITGSGNQAAGATTASDSLMLSFTRGGSLNLQRGEAELDGVVTGVDTDLATTAGTQYQYVMTFEDGVGTYGSNGGRITWYRNGQVLASRSVAFHLSQLEDVNNWLGRSLYSGDSTTNAAYNELRIYDKALAADEIAMSYQRGVDASFAPPELAADEVTIHAGQKVRIPVLKNDTGGISPNSVEIVTPPSAGTATVNADGSILYTHAGGSIAPVSFTYRAYGAGGWSQPANVTVSISSALRIANPGLAMPTEPPPTFLQLVDALPGVTFTEPIVITTPPGETKRLFVGERMAKIQLVPDVTAAQPTKQLFLDLQQVVAGRTPSETIENWVLGENGLLGMAFHPNYATNGYFYVAYTVQINGGSYYERISRFKVDPNNPNLGDPSSELVLLQQLDEGFNHNGGDLHFGPDGYLYYAAGDEENPNDFRLNSQRIDKDFFSGIFRIDVDKKPGNLEPNPHAAIPTDGGVARFSVPVDNPFVPASLGGTWNGTFNGVAIADLGTVRMEYWATGLRHPWRMSFDPPTGDLWVGDVGQDAYEEVDKIQKGGNYGWVYREGLHDTNLRNPVPAGFTSIDPLYEYPHPAVAGADPLYSGSSIVGGYVYRGSRISSLAGAYVFCDSVSGNVWKRDPNTGGVSRITGVGGAYGGLVSMGVDPSNGDLLFCDYINSRLLRIATSTLGNSFPSTLSATGLFADLADLSPSPGLLPYEPNVTFWSDYAIKRRWFGIPNGTDKLTWSKDENWTFPTGAVWVKHFDLELTRGNPATKRRIETRVIVKTESNVYGVSYRWNDAQTEATLVPDEGAEFDIDVVENGAPHVQRWAIPSRASCLTCHTPQAGGSLSFTTRQLNRTASMNGFFGNELTLLHDGGYFTNDPGSPNLLPRHLRADETAYPLEARVRSYLAVNCAYCHRVDGTVNGANWDGRSQLTLAQTGLINGVPTNNHGDPANKYIVPGDTSHSVIYNRIAVQNGFTRMPPLGSTELDPVSIALLQEWISTALPARQDYSGWRQQNFGSSATPEGEPVANPDFDPLDNQGEYLAGTAPKNGGSAFRPVVTAGTNSATVAFDLPALRSFQIETTADLQTWWPWDAPGNGGVPVAGGPISISGPTVSPRQFFRVKIWEN